MQGARFHPAGPCITCLSCSASAYPAAPAAGRSTGVPSGFTRGAYEYTHWGLLLRSCRWFLFADSRTAAVIPVQSRDVVSVVPYSASFRMPSA